ncbi:hypothetical protein CEXT_20801 [Caerostris extrusa]|uniref:Uncharacterized protein n=1 Tax=Caerostris extrusa TaxID=172846 RepID=A0AAV4SU53_CAEEX|nr:hypothetical protein CEXT_20801 [Caerostris extrusa]
MFTNHKNLNPPINSTSRLATITLLNFKEAPFCTDQSFLAINTKVIAQSFAFNARIRSKGCREVSPSLNLERGNKFAALNLGSREFYAPRFPCIVWRNRVG